MKACWVEGKLLESWIVLKREGGYRVQYHLFTVQMRR